MRESRLVVPARESAVRQWGAAIADRHRSIFPELIDLSVWAVGRDAGLVGWLRRGLRCSLKCFYVVWAAGSVRIGQGKGLDT